MPKYETLDKAAQKEVIHKNNADSFGFFVSILFKLLFKNVTLFSFFYRFGVLNLLKRVILKKKMPLQLKNAY